MFAAFCAILLTIYIAIERYCDKIIKRRSQINHDFGRQGYEGTGKNNIKKA